MKKYRIKVNGKTYEVELEAVEETKSVASPVEAKKEVSPAPSVASEGEKQVLAPLQGTVVALKVKVGDTVKKGQSVALIEAMKLENDVASPFDGVVASISVSKGASVSNKDVLMTLK